MLWDTQQRTIVNNESADILRIFNLDFSSLARHEIDLRPPAPEEEIVRVNPILYNGIYQQGFTGSQGGHDDEAAGKTFAALDWMQHRLSTAPWLVGGQLTGTDIRAFVTPVRFALAYYGLFKCNLKPLSAYPAVPCAAAQNARLRDQ